MKKFLLTFLTAVLLSANVMAFPLSEGGAFNSAGTITQYTPGTWTPAVTAAGTAGTPAYTTQVGSFEQIGREVHVQFTIVLSGWTGSPAGNVTITGLPSAATATANDNGGCVITQYTVTGLASTNYGIDGVIAPSATAITLYSEGNTGTANVTAAQTGTTPTLIGFCVYHT
jgi:hypothetical protein